VSLTAADVAEIMKVLEGSGFDEVLLEIDGLKLSMRRGGAGAADGSGGVATLSAAAGTNAAPTSLGTGTSPAPNVRGTGSTAQPTSGGQQSAAAAAALAPAADPAEGPSKTTASTDPTVQDVTSPLLGTCYRAPKPGAPPFVEVGTLVNEDTVVAIVEVMKLMNTVRAGVKGTVTEILMRDGALVEYGEALLRIKKAG